MKTFRVIHFKRGFIDLYQSQVKTWIGWRSFSTHSDGSIYFLSNPSTNQNSCLNGIKNYRRAKGWLLEEIEIILK